MISVSLISVSCLGGASSGVYQRSGRKSFWMCHLLSLRMTITSKNVHLSLAIDLGRKTLRVRRGSFPNSRKYEVKRYKNDRYYKENEDDHLKS